MVDIQQKPQQQQSKSNQAPAPSVSTTPEQVQEKLIGTALESKPPTHAGTTAGIADALNSTAKKERVWCSFADFKAHLEAARREQLDAQFFGAVQDGRVLPLGGGDYLMLLQIAGKSGVRLDIRKVYTEKVEDSETGDMVITKDSLLRFGKGYSGSNLHRTAMIAELAKLK